MVDVLRVHLLKEVLLVGRHLLEDWGAIGFARVVGFYCGFSEEMVPEVA